MMNYELALDNQSNVIKIVADGEHVKKGVYSNGTKINYIINSNKIISNRSGGIKTYIHRSDSETSIPNIMNEFPAFPDVDMVVGHYSELKTGTVVKAKEWYLALKSEIDLINIYTYFQQAPPSGYYYDMFNADPQQHRFHGTEPGYNYCMSIEILEDNSIVLEWYMNVDRSTVDNILSSWGSSWNV